MLRTKSGYYKICTKLTGNITELQSTLQYREYYSTNGTWSNWKSCTDHIVTSDDNNMYLCNTYDDVLSVECANQFRYAIGDSYCESNTNWFRS